jgi:hypothetical protein
LQCPICKFLATLLLVVFAADAAANVSRGLNGAEGKNMTITNLEEHDEFIVVTFSAPLESGAACAATHRNVLVLDGTRNVLAQTARKAFSLGQAVNVWGGAACTRMKEFETMSIMEITK